MSRLREMFEEGWYRELESHLQSTSFREIGYKLHKLAKTRVEITPKFSDTFRAFKECPWSKLHTVLLGQDPYPAKVDDATYVADGLAFSSRYSKECPVSLNYLFESIDRDIYKGQGYHLAKDFDLSRWANQGILLINTALSYPIGSKSGAHANLWHPFITTVLKAINDRKDGVAFGLFGNYAKAYKPLLTNQTCAVYTCEHPAATAYRGKGSKWEDKRIFKSIDAYHKTFNNIKIDW